MAACWREVRGPCCLRALGAHQAAGHLPLPCSCFNTLASKRWVACPHLVGTLVDSCSCCQRSARGYRPVSTNKSPCRRADPAQRLGPGCHPPAAAESGQDPRWAGQAGCAGRCSRHIMSQAACGSASGSNPGIPLPAYPSSFPPACLSAAFCCGAALPMAQGAHTCSHMLSWASLGPVPPY